MKKSAILGKEPLCCVPFTTQNFIATENHNIYHIASHVLFCILFFLPSGNKQHMVSPLGRSSLWPSTPAALAVINQPRKIASLRNGTEINLLIRKRYGKLDRADIG